MKMSYELTDKDALKLRTKSTAMRILGLVEGVEVSDLAESLFIYSDDELTREMLNRYEKQILIAKIKPEEFKRGLHLFFTDMAKYIKKNNLIKNFSFLYYIVCKEQNENALSKNVIFNLYVDMISQQFPYFCKNETILYGVETKGKPILVRDPYPYLDYPIMVLEKYNIGYNPNFLKKEYKKLGYDVKDVSELDFLFNKYALTSTAIHTTSFLIDENTIDMASFNHIDLSKPMDLPLINIGTYINVDNYINERNRFLRNGEVEIDLVAGDVRKIELKEVFFNNSLYLLYKITNSKNESYTGLYDTKDDFFVSPYTGMSNEKVLHDRLKYLILEIYIICTTDIDKDLTRFYDFQMNIKKSPIKDVNNIKRYYKKYTRDDLIKDLAEVNSYIRKLPIGATASEEAIENARQYGINLKPGETFVKSFEKTIYKKR